MNVSARNLPLKKLVKFKNDNKEYTTLNIDRNNINVVWVQNNASGKKTNRLISEITHIDRKMVTITK